MKKTRIIASLLCIMMIVCALPMMQASAAAGLPALAPSNLGKAVAGVLNINGNTSAYTWARPMTEFDVTSWAPCNLDFTDPDMATNPYLTVLNNSVSFGAEGATLGANGIMRYFPGAANPGGDATNWSPVAESNYYCYSFKLSESGNLFSWTHVAGGNYTGALVEVTPESVIVYSGQQPGDGARRTVDTEGNPLVTYYDTDNKYLPGTGWNDVLIKMSNTNNPYQVWMKKANDPSFTKIAEAKLPTNIAPPKSDGSYDYYYDLGFGGECTTRNKGLTFWGSNTNVGYATTFKPVTAPLYDSIEDITGGIVASTHAFDFDSEYCGTYKRDGWTSYSENVTFTDENGMYLPANEDGSATNWHYSGHKGRWSPFSYGAASGGFLPSSVYLKIKGALTVQLRAKGNNQRMVQLVFDANSGKMPDGSGGTSNELNYYDEWTEYLIVPKTASETAGYTLYAKGEKSTNGVWVRVADKNSYIVGGEDNTGINITGTGGYVKAIRILRPGVTDAEILPSNANYKWFGDEMDEAVKYNNLSQSGTIYTDGVATWEAGGQFSVGYAPIPVGGYAEFRTRAKNRQEIYFVDDGQGININFAKDYHTITGGNGFMTDSNCTWRTWRVVRTENGYNIYSKVDTDSGWLVVGENAIQALASMADGSSFKFHSDATEGTDTYMDYLRIYGPAPTNPLTVTDGYGTRVLQNGDKIGYGGAVRPIITDVESGKLLVVCYKGNDMLKASIYDVEDLTDTTFLSAHIGGCDTAKFFLWDGFSKMNSLAEPLVVGY